MSEETVQCITCSRFTLRDPRFKGDAKGMKLSREMAGHGFGNCAVKPTWEFMSPTYPRECRHHHQAKDEELQVRMDWLHRSTNSSTA